MGGERWTAELKILELRILRWARGACALSEARDPSLARSVPAEGATNVHVNGEVAREANGARCAVISRWASGEGELRRHGLGGVAAGRP